MGDPESSNATVPRVKDLVEELRTLKRILSSSLISLDLLSCPSDHTVKHLAKA
jgi:hypothetical protein